MEYIASSTSWTSSSSWQQQLGRDLSFLAQLEENKSVFFYPPKHLMKKIN
jgi:hypothetical protein